MMCTWVCDGLPLIPSQITRIINVSLTSGIFPEGWQQAEVAPTAKKGDHEQPIITHWSLCYQCYQRWESVALNHLTAYLITNNQLPAEQSGNKNFHSTETALFRATDAIFTGMDKQELSTMVLLVISTAFDCINHDILLLKIQDLFISEYTLVWLSSLLLDQQISSLAY